MYAEVEVGVRARDLRAEICVGVADACGCGVVAIDVNDRRLNFVCGYGRCGRARVLSKWRGLACRRPGGWLPLGAGGCSCENCGELVAARADFRPVRFFRAALVCVDAIG